MKIPYVYTHVEYPPGEHQLPKMVIHGIKAVGEGLVQIGEDRICFVRIAAPFDIRELKMPIFVQRGILTFEGAGVVGVKGIKEDVKFLRAYYACRAIALLRGKCLFAERTGLSVDRLSALWAKVPF